MYLHAEILDDLLLQAFEVVLKEGRPAEAGRGRNLELLGVLLELKNPRARLSRSETKGRPFSALGELLWYLSGRDDLEFIERYIPGYADDAEPDGTLFGAYGPRLLNMRGENQLSNIVDALRDRKGTRRAVIQLFNAEDISSRHKEVPCTTSMQFLLRDNQLSCCVSMRSNDAFKGLPHDIFCFTMIQEMIARDLESEIGTYKHFAGSLHLYEESINGAERYLSEGIHSSLPMPEMPAGPQWSYIPLLMEAEAQIRAGRGSEASYASLPPYWQDLLRLLVAFENSGDIEALDALSGQLASDTYQLFLQRRKSASKPKRGQH